MRKIRFSGFPPRLKDEAALRNILGTLGKVVSVHVSTSEKGEVMGTCKFSDADEAAVTLAALNGFKIGDHTIKVEREDSDGDDGKRREEKKKRKEEEKSHVPKEMKPKAATNIVSADSSSKVSSKSAGDVTKPKAEKLAKPTMKRDLAINDEEESKPKKAKVTEAKASGQTASSTLSAKEKQTESASIKRLSGASEGEKKKSSQAAGIKKPSTEGSEVEKKKKVDSAELVRQSSDGVEKKKKMEQPGDVKRSSSATNPDKGSKTSDLGDLVRKPSPQPADAVKKTLKKKEGEEKSAKSVQEVTKEPTKEGLVTDGRQNPKKPLDVSDKEKRKLAISAEQEKTHSVTAAVAKKPKEDLSQKSDIGIAPTKKLKTEVAKPDVTEKLRPASEVQKQTKISDDPTKSKAEATSESVNDSSKGEFPRSSALSGQRLDGKQAERAPTSLAKPEEKLERTSSGMSSAEEKARQKEMAIAAAKSAMSGSTQQALKPVKEEAPKNTQSKAANDQKQKDSSTESTIGSGKASTEDSGYAEVWEEYFDEGYQVPYYYNPATDQTTWELPPPGSKIVKVVSTDTSAAGEETSASKDMATRGEETIPPSNEPLISTISKSAEGRPADLPSMQRESSAAVADPPVRSRTISQTTIEASVPGVQRSSTSPPGPLTASSTDVRAQHQRESFSGTPLERMPSTGSLSTSTRPPFTLPEELEHRKGETISGVITDLKNHYGFIRCQTTPTFSLKGDMFFHFDELVPTYVAPKLGDEVEFEIGFNVKRRRPIALAVRKPGMKRSSTSVSPAGSPALSSTTLPPTSTAPGVSGGISAATAAGGAMHFPAPSPTSSVPSVPSARGGGGLASAGPAGYNRRDTSSSAMLQGSAPRQRSRDRLPSREGVSRPGPRRRSRSPPGAVRRQHSSPGVLQSTGGGTASASQGNRFSHTRDQPSAVPQRRKDLEWKMYVDRTSNQPYWFCTQTGETTWVNPHIHRQ